MAIKFDHIILAVKVLGRFFLKWTVFGELLGWKSSTQSGNSACFLETPPAVNRPVCVCLCVCVLVYMVYEDTNVFLKFKKCRQFPVMGRFRGRGSVGG